MSSRSPQSPAPWAQPLPKTHQTPKAQASPISTPEASTSTDSPAASPAPSGSPPCPSPAPTATASPTSSAAGGTPSSPPSGAVDILNAPGDGQYSDADNYILNPSFAGSTFVFNNNRAPYTDVDFPLQLVSATAGSSLLSGEYTTLTQTVNPETADILSSKTEQTTVSVIGPSFRVTDADGEFYRGSFETPTRVGFRVVVPTPSDTRFRTFPGSSLSQNQNLMGSVRITSINTFEATFLFQSRTGLGNQSQGITIMSGQRVDPYPVGDLDGDRVVDSDDRAMLVKQIGLVEADDAFNIAADLNGDYEITEADLALFDQGECSADFADPFGELDFFDVSAFLDLFANQDPRADLSGPDGAFDFFDVSAFLDSFGAGCP